MKRGIIAAALCAALSVGAMAEPTVGKKAPDFSLKGADGKTYSLSDLKGKHVVLEWINLGCPFVKKHYDSGNMQSAQASAIEKGALWFAVATSAEGKQGHYDAAGWKEQVAEKKIAANAVLIDDKGKVGKAYGAKTTPHMFVIDPQGVLIYKGAIDDKPTTDTDDVPGAKNYVLAALNESMDGKPVSTTATTPYGCSVKYK